MTLYIAEKPSLGRAIADGLVALNRLPKPKKAEGYLELANGDVVSWCIGHLLEQVEPEAYDPSYKAWKHETLPIVPQQWQLKAKPKTRKQLSVLRKLIKQADHIVHAGDPDREGQLLVDEVINFSGVKGRQLAAVQRCLISDLNLDAVKLALTQLRSNQDFIPLSTSALARSRADWLYGINMTRAYTLQGKSVGYQGVLSVGRVQTPLLGLVVRRDNEIDNFTPHAFYDVWANLQTDDQSQFKAKWQPSESCSQYLDEQGRNLSRPLAENVVGRISGQPAQVSKYSAKVKKQAPPLPHSLSSLQIDASKVFGMSAQQVLDTCQALYEKHKLITYPRSDSRYLPRGHFSQAADVLASVKSNSEKVGFTDLLNVYDQLDCGRRSKAWNDAKVDAHHAIIPTQANTRSLSDSEVKVYRLVCRNYMAQFLEDYCYEDAQAEVIIAGGLFITKAKKPLEPGWKCLFPNRKNKSKNSEDPSDDDAFNAAGLPRLVSGQQLQSLQAEVVDKQTSPPKHFTDATLLAAMTGIARFVSDPELRKVLKETDGLGTEATRAGIIELLFKRGFLSRQGKTIRATPAGKGLVAALPDSATWPDMTARWESLLAAISEKQAKYEQLMTPLISQLHELVVQSQSVVPNALRGLSGGSAKGYKKPYKKTGKGGYKKPRSSGVKRSGKKSTAAS